MSTADTAVGLVVLIVILVVIGAALGVAVGILWLIIRGARRRPIRPGPTVWDDDDEIAARYHH